MIAPPERPHATPDERAERGRSARAEVKRSDLGASAPAPGRRDPIDILKEQARSRQQDLLPIRYGRMAASPFAFFRGAAAVMAADLAPSPVTGMKVQAIGDAHVSNFGIFASPERRLVFDANDFDETLPAPWEWDVKRLVASAAVAAEDSGASREAATAAARRVATAYRESMRTFAADKTFDIWYAHIDIEDLIKTQGRKSRKAQNEAMLRKARTRTSRQVAGKLAERVDGELRFKSIPPLVTPLRELFAGDDADRVQDMIRRGFAGYRKSLAPEIRLLLDRFRPVDVARKVVGVGSVGTRCLIALFVGRDEDDPLVLQLKEAETSVLEPYAGRSVYRHKGARVVHGQRLVQVSSDIFLGWNSLAEGQHYYWRQLKDMKGSIEIGWLDAKAFDRYLDGCAWCLARAHARSGDPIAIAAYLGRGSSFDKAMTAFAVAYADQTTADWEMLRQAITDGRVEAASDV